MYMSKKKVFSLALVVIMVAILSFSTLAWFSDADDVTNNFGIAGSDTGKPEDVFSVDVWEEVPDGDDADQDPDIVDEDNVNDSHTYENILPGDLLLKTVHVENTGKYDQFVRVKVTMSDAAAWQSILPAGYDLTQIFKGYDDTLWIRVDEPAYDATADTITYTFYLEQILLPGTDVELFTHVEIPSWLSQVHMARLTNGFAMDIVAEAVQTKNVGANALEAFATVTAAQQLDQIPDVTTP